jgi:hypothetical protein
MKDERARMREELARAGEPDEDPRARQRNAGIAIAVLAVVVAALLLAMVSGATDAFTP